MDRPVPIDDIVAFLVSRISGFTELKDNWDGYCAFPTTPSAVARSVRILKALQERGLLGEEARQTPLPRRKGQAGEPSRGEIGHGGMEISATREGGVRFDWIDSGSRFTSIVPSKEDEEITLEDARPDPTTGRSHTSVRTTNDCAAVAELLEAALRDRL